MEMEWQTQAVLFLRLLLACICGGTIGYERQNRLKVAGVRTHLIVALGAALMTEVSKYGFWDVLGAEGIGLDPSRVAAQIVSGVGFLGVGIIFVRKKEVNGLTTAAGIWTTAGVGMALGAGMYLIGIASAVLILVVQIVLHRNHKWLPFYMGERIVFELEDGDATLRYVRDKLAENHIRILGTKAKRDAETGYYRIEFELRVSGVEKMNELLDLFSGNKHIVSVEV